MARERQPSAPEETPGAPPSDPPSDLPGSQDPASSPPADSEPSSTEDGAHVLGIDPGPAPGGEPGADQGEASSIPGPPGPRPPAGLLSLEQFTAGLALALTLSGHALQLRTLVESTELETWEPAAEAVYQTILEVPALHWIIQPGNRWFMRLVTVGAWAVPVAAGCRAELAERRAEAREQAARAANDTRADA